MRTCMFLALHDSSFQSFLTGWKNKLMPLRNLPALSAVFNIREWRNSKNDPLHTLPVTTIYPAMCNFMFNYLYYLCGPRTRRAKQCRTPLTFSVWNYNNEEHLCPPQVHTEASRGKCLCSDWVTKAQPFWMQRALLSFAPEQHSRREQYTKQKALHQILDLPGSCTFQDSEAGKMNVHCLWSTSPWHSGGAALTG